MSDNLAIEIARHRRTQERLTAQTARADALARDYQEECQLHHQDIKRNIELQPQLATETARADAAEKILEQIMSLQVPRKYSARFTYGWGCCLNLIKELIQEQKP